MVFLYMNKVIENSDNIFVEQNKEEIVNIYNYLIKEYPLLNKDILWYNSVENVKNKYKYKKLIQSKL